jgi:hypothetical protein
MKRSYPVRFMFFFLLCFVGSGVVLLLSPARGESLFPEVEGWKQRETVQVFSPENLYEYIDGAAELYLAYDFQELQVAEYVGGKDGLIIVDIYRHATPLYAFGIYSQERLPRSLYLDIGDQGYWEQGVLNFLSGRYYVKITNHKPGKRDQETLKNFAGQVNAKLGGKTSLPRILSAFPQEGKKKYSEKFIARNFLGYSFFPSGFEADYEISGKKFKLFVIEGKDPAECRRMVAAYLRFVGSHEKDFVPGLHSVSDPHHGKVDLAWKGKHIWGVLNLDDAHLRSKFLILLEQGLQESP